MTSPMPGPEAFASGGRHRSTEHRRLIEGLRVVLAIIAGLLMLDAAPDVLPRLSLAVLAFSVYAVVLLWQAANGSALAQSRMFHWLDALWFLMLVAFSGAERTHYFLLLFFPVYFAAWRKGYAESIAVAAFCGMGAVIIFALRDPAISWVRLAVLPLSLFVVGPLLVALAQVEAATRRGQMFAASMVEGLDPRRGFDTIIPDLLGQVAGQLGASAAILALKTFEGRKRVFCWEVEDGASELTAGAAESLAEKALSLGPDIAFGRRAVRRWWERDNLIGVGRNGQPVATTPGDREMLAELGDLIGKPRLLCVPLYSPGVGYMRVIAAGESIEVTIQAVDILAHIVEQVAPSVENAYLRERLAAEAAETERARIGRDLHDSAIQPYIGLKFALEAVQRRAGADNPVAEELSSLVSMAAQEVNAMREVIAGLRGAPGKGGALLSTAVRRQALRFGQLFGIKTEVHVEGEMPVSRRIAGDMFHIVAEGLSNIRRHTRARQAWISLKAEDGLLVLKIRNAADPETDALSTFAPRSLSERAEALGGSVEVDSDASSTTVTVRVPIPETLAIEGHR